MHDEIALPAEAMTLARQGNLIAAIKLTRESSGCGLKEAKEAVEAFLRSGTPVSAAETAHAPAELSELPLHAILSLEKGRLIDAIKQTREASGLGLKAAKECVEAYLERNPGTRARFRAAASAQRRQFVGKLSWVLLGLALATLVYLWIQGAVG